MAFRSPSARATGPQHRELATISQPVSEHYGTDQEERFGSIAPFWSVTPMSGLPPVATIKRTSLDVGEVPLTTKMHRSKTATLFDYLVGSGKERRWHGEAKRLRGFEID